MARISAIALMACVGVLSAIAAVGSDQWVSASYDAGAKTRSLHNQKLVTRTGGDEAYWLSKSVRPIVSASHQSASAPVATTAFEVGARITVSGSEPLTLDIVDSRRVDPGSGLLDSHGRPLVLLTARVRGDADRIVRLLVESGVPAVPSVGKAL